MPDYDINLDVKYEPLTFIDLDAEAAAVTPWFNQTLSRVNDAVIRLGVIEGDFHWHKHDVEDEFFLVLSGQLLIDLEDRETVVLDPHQGFASRPASSIGRARPSAPRSSWSSPPAWRRRATDGYTG